MADPSPEALQEIEPSSADLAYAAGFFDGEGTFAIMRQKSRSASGRDYFRAVAVVTNTDRTVLEELQLLFGGRLYVHAVKSRPTYWRTAHQWHLWGNQLERFIVGVRPYLRLKRALADNLLDFIALKHQTGRRRKAPLDIWARMQELHSKHRALTPMGRPGRVLSGKERH